MAQPVILERGQIKEIRSLCSSGPDTFIVVLNRLKTIEPNPVPPEELFEKVGGGLPPEIKQTAIGILQQLFFLYGWVRQGGATIEQVVEAVREGNKSAPEGTKSDLDNWAKVEPVFKELLSLVVVRLVAGALDLAVEYPNLLRTARILTDIRPIFSEDQKAIEGAVVSHTLRIRYDNTLGPHELFLCIDDADITNLAQQCDRARRKAADCQENDDK